jgi:hypothetical protein
MCSIKTLIPLAIAAATSACASRPTAFHEQYIATRHVPYRFIESRQHPSSSGGVLQEGQAVWLAQAVQRTELAWRVEAFVEDIGLVSLDRRLIKRGDGSVSADGLQSLA